MLAMYSLLPTPLTIITNWHQDRVIEKKASPLVGLCNPHKSNFKVVAHSHSHSHSSSTTNKLASTPSTPSKKIFSSINNTKGGLSIFDICVSYMSKVSVKLLNPSLHPSVDPKLVLTGNFAPVDETPPTKCLQVMEGEIPLSLNGAYIRNGPNPQHQPGGPHHLWSGDGMLHSIRLSKGRAIFCSRYVKTYKYKLENDKGFPVIPNVFSGFYSLGDLCNTIINLGRSMAERINLGEAFGLANTSLALFHGNLFALMEGDLPYAIQLTQEGDIETIQRYDFGGKAPLNMTAHPKIDAETGELFSFQLSIKYPYLTFFRFRDRSSNREDVPIHSMNRLSFVHDFAITKQYAIFPDIQLEISLNNLWLCRGIPLSYQGTKISRIGVIPRYATTDSEMSWFQVPGFNAFHILNAWEENDGHIVIVTPTISCPDNYLYRVDDFHISLEKIRIDMKTGNILRTILSERNLEMGSINPAYYGKKNKYVYMSINESSLKMSGVVKIDLELEREVSSRFYGAGCFGGEALFVAKRDSNCNEDDGFLVTYVHNEIANESQFVVMDAKSLNFVCKVKLPGRVPYGFHGLFVSEEQLESL